MTELWSVLCKDMTTARKAEGHKSKCGRKCWFHWQPGANLKHGSICFHIIRIIAQMLHINTVILQHWSCQWFIHCLDCSSIFFPLETGSEREISAIERSMDDISNPASKTHTALTFLVFMVYVGSAVGRSDCVSQIKTCLKEITLMTALVGARRQEDGCNIPAAAF